MIIQLITRILFSGIVLVHFGLGHASIWAFPVPIDLQNIEVKVISNPDIPVPPAGKRKSLVFKEELTIGQKEGDENYMFGSAVFFNTDEEGNFYVTDWDKKRILKYDPAGKYVLTIGRKGQGPGEFQGITVARFDKDGSIYVTDLSNRRISFFNQQGLFLRQVLVPDFFEDLYITAKGSYISNHTVPIQSDAGQAFQVVDGIFNDKFELMTQFYAHEVVYKLPGGTDAIAMAKYFAGLVSRVAFQPAPRHVLASDGMIYFGYPKDYAIEVYSPEGYKAKTIKREFKSIRVKDKDKDHFAATVVRPALARIGRPFSEKDIQDVLRLIEYPDNKPAYQSFTLMENGWLVVLVEYAVGEYSLIDIFDENGRYIGQFRTDYPVHEGLFFKNGKAYALETDEAGYKFVKRYGIIVEDY